MRQAADKEQLTTLWDVPAGRSCTVKAFLDELPRDYQVRLSELGFLPGGEVQCELTPKLGAPHLYRVDNTVYSLDARVARQVLVQH